MDSVHHCISSTPSAKTSRKYVSLRPRTSSQLQYPFIAIKHQNTKHAKMSYCLGFYIISRACIGLRPRQQVIGRKMQMW